MNKRKKIYLPIAIGILLALCHSIYLLRAEIFFYSRQFFHQNYEHPIYCTVTLIKKSTSSLKLTFRNLDVILDVHEADKTIFSMENVKRDLEEMKLFISSLKMKQTLSLGSPSFFFRDCTDDTRPIVTMTIEQIQKELNQDKLFKNLNQGITETTLPLLAVFYIMNILIYIYFARTYE